MPTPDFLFSLANPTALLGWTLLVLAPRSRFTKALVLNGALPLELVAAYAALIAAHYLGAHGGTGSFGSLGQVAALFRDPWALLAGWVYYPASTFLPALGRRAMPSAAACRMRWWCRRWPSRSYSGRWACCYTSSCAGYESVKP